MLMEVQFPDGDGFTFLKKLKQTYSFPVIFVTGRVAESDRILGFELGADDYVCKPFSSKELVLRVHALFRRIDVSVSAFKSGSTWTLGNSVLQLDEVSHLFSVDGRQVPLTAASG
jgi:DNA-binding response OmpR family regulator